MNEQNENKSRNKAAATEGTEPAKVIRKGAVAASIWRRQSPNGFAYYDFTLSRSWKAMSSEKTGYSKNFFGTNVPNLQDVIIEASIWITQNSEAPDWITQNGKAPKDGQSATMAAN